MADDKPFTHSVRGWLVAGVILEEAHARTRCDEGTNLCPRSTVLTSSRWI